MYSFFDLKVFLFLGCLFSINLAEAQPKQDSNTLFTLETNLAPIEKWDLLFPFLKEKAANWDNNQINFADTLVQLAKDYFPTKLAEAYSISGD
ncbi:MAG: hypothetical protein ACI9P5_004036 [Saprospiraceae bacterium]